MYGVSAPRNCERRSLREVLQNDDLKWGLIGRLPVIERDIFRNSQFTSGPDRFICKLTGSGQFSVKAFVEHLAPINPQSVRPWGKVIWRSWIPPKISSFLWKIFHKVVPTDENIKRINIPVVSRCRCCSRPAMESSDHLFYSSEWAIPLWDKLAAIFDRPRQRGNGTLCHYWLRGNKKCFIDCLASGMASCLIWEIWKARNSSIHETRSSPIWLTCLSWASRLAGNIKASFSPSVQSMLVLQACHLPPPPRLGRSASQIWRPPDAVIARDDSSIGRSRYLVPQPMDDSRNPNEVHSVLVFHSDL